MHNAAFAALGVDAAFAALPVAPEGLADAVRGLSKVDCLGLSVTIPHKQAVMPLCDAVDNVATAIGAVNCVSFSDGRICGHNTDAKGFMNSLAACGDVGEKAVVLGAGGAARAVAYGLEESGRTVVVLARRPETVSWAQSELFTQSSVSTHLPTCDLLVDCTPSGLQPGGIKKLPAELPLSTLSPECVVASLVYHREPELLSQAREIGLRTLDGAGMLAHQGALALELWLGQKAPFSVMLQAVRDGSTPVD